MATNGAAAISINPSKTFTGRKKIRKSFGRIPEIAEMPNLIEVQKSIIKRLLQLIKECHHKAVNPRLIILTSNAIAELAIGEPNLSHSPLTGFCKTLHLELPAFQTTLIDLDTREPLQHATQVLQEINYNHGQSHESVIAWRRGNRLVSR